MAGLGRWRHGRAAVVLAQQGPDGILQVLDLLGRFVPLDRIRYVIAANKLHLEPSPDGSRHGRIEAAIVVYDQEGQTLNWSLRQIDLDMDAAHYPAVEENGIHFSLEIDAPKEGFYLRSGVYDWGSNLAGTLEVPINRLVRDTPVTASK
jgi:hypothetical protein